MIYGEHLLEGVHPDLVRLVTHGVAGGLTIGVVQGARSLADEQHAIDTGHSALHNPLDSKHVVDPVHRPLALAVDLVPFDHAPTAEEWKDIPAFQALASNLKALADAIGVSIAWGGDWHSFKDWDHIELVEAHG